jgi:hypothetical protein
MNADKEKEANLEILAVKEKDDCKMPVSYPVTDNLLPHPWVLTCIAPCASGKTVLLANVLLRFYPNCFDAIYYWSPTADMCKTTKSFLKAYDDSDQDITVFSKHEDLMNIDGYIELICEEQAKTKQEERKKVLFVFDDIIGYKMKKLNYLASRHRHFSISIFYSGQAYRKMDPIIRVNSSAAIFFKVANLKEFKKIEEELLENVPGYLDYYNTATAKRYDFLYFDIRRQKLFHNFHTLLWEK